MNHCLAGILFDLDETLLDRSGTLQRYAAVLFSDFENSARIGFDEFDRLVTELDDHGVTPREAFFAGLADAAFPDIAAKALEDHFYAHAWSNPIPFPGVVDCLTEFRAKGIPTGIVTNGGIRSQSAKIRNSGVGSLVDAYLISEEFGIRKPEPEIFLHISEFLQIDPARSWFVGDDPVRISLEHRAWGSGRFGWKDTCLGQLTIESATISRPVKCQRLPLSCSLLPNKLLQRAVRDKVPKASPGHAAAELRR